MDKQGWINLADLSVGTAWGATVLTLYFLATVEHIWALWCGGFALFAALCAVRLLLEENKRLWRSRNKFEYLSRMAAAEKSYLNKQRVARQNAQQQLKSDAAEQVKKTFQQFGGIH